MKNIVLALGLACISATSVAAPPVFPVEVYVTNADPIPVILPTAPKVICTRDVGSAGGSDNPFRAIGFAGPLTAIQCPAGVYKLKVDRIGFTPDVGSGSAFNVATFRATVGVQQTGLSLPGTPSGLLAVMTEGAPLADVAQDFVLDTTDTTRSLFAHITVSSSIETVSVTLGGTIFFVGTPVD